MYEFDEPPPDAEDRPACEVDVPSSAGDPDARIVFRIDDRIVGRAALVPERGLVFDDHPNLSFETTQAASEAMCEAVDSAHDNEMPGPLPGAPCQCYTQEQLTRLVSCGCPHCPGCQPESPGCMCMPTERALRAWSTPTPLPYMTLAQREWCLARIVAVEGYDRADYAGRPDDELASGVLRAWTDYVRDKGLR